MSEIIRNKMKELFEPIEQQILMTDNPTELLMLASIMISSSRRIFVTALGKEKTQQLIKEWLENWDYYEK